MINRRTLIAFLVVLHPVTLRAIDNKSGDLDAILSSLSFKPHFPSEKLLVERYGSGFVSAANGLKYRNYYQAGTGIWFQFRTDVKNKKHAPVTEVLLSKLPLALDRESPKQNISSDSIKGVKFGDSIKQVKKIFGLPLREYTGTLDKAPLKIMEYFPSTLEIGSCIRFYMENDQVVAFSFSSEE